MRKKHQATLRAVFKKPTSTNIVWTDIESLLSALGAELTEGSGSRARIALNDIRAVFHRPHPRKEASKAQVESMRIFLINAGIEYENTKL